MARNALADVAALCVADHMRVPYKVGGGINRILVDPLRIRYSQHSIRMVSDGGISVDQMAASIEIDSGVMNAPFPTILVVMRGGPLSFEEDQGNPEDCDDYGGVCDYIISLDNRRLSALQARAITELPHRLLVEVKVLVNKTDFYKSHADKFCTDAPNGNVCINFVNQKIVGRDPDAIKQHKTNPYTWTGYDTIATYKGIPVRTLFWPYADTPIALRSELTETSISTGSDESLRLFKLARGLVQPRYTHVEKEEAAYRLECLRKYSHLPSYISTVYALMPAVGRHLEDNLTRNFAAVRILKEAGEDYTDAITTAVSYAWMLSLIVGEELEEKLRGVPPLESLMTKVARSPYISQIFAASTEVEDFPYDELEMPLLPTRVDHRPSGFFFHIQSARSFNKFYVKTCEAPRKGSIYQAYIEYAKTLTEAEAEAEERPVVEEYVSTSTVEDESTPQPEAASPEAESPEAESPEAESPEAESAPVSITDTLASSLLDFFAPSKPKVTDVLSKADIVIFNSETCPYCAAAVKAAKATEYSVHVELAADYRQELIDMTGQTSLPWVWVKGEFVGGCNDGPRPDMGLLPIIEQGRLKALIEGGPVEPSDEVSVADPVEEVSEEAPPNQDGLDEQVEAPDEESQVPEQVEEPLKEEEAVPAEPSDSGRTTFRVNTTNGSMFEVTYTNDRFTVTAGADSGISDANWGVRNLRYNRMWVAETSLSKYSTMLFDLGLGYYMFVGDSIWVFKYDGEVVDYIVEDHSSESRVNPNVVTSDGAILMLDEPIEVVADATQNPFELYFSDESLGEPLPVIELGTDIEVPANGLAGAFWLNKDVWYRRETADDV